MFNTWTIPSLSETFPSLPNPGLNNRTVNIITANNPRRLQRYQRHAVHRTPARSVRRWRVRALSFRVARRFSRRAIRRLGVKIPPFMALYVRDYVLAAEAAGLKETPTR